MLVYRMGLSRSIIRIVFHLNQTKIKLIIISLVCLFSVLCGSSWAQSSIGSDQLKSINQFEKGEFGAVKVVTKAWRETFDPQSRFDISFFGYFDEPEDVRDLMQEILVFNGKEQIRVYDWDSADCSIEKMMLIKEKDSTVYLLIGGRVGISGEGEVIPLSDPAPETIIIYQLVANHFNAVGYPRCYFQKVTETITESRVCGANDVYNFMLGSISELHKNRR